VIVTNIDRDFPLFRAHSPKWASQPLSGAGAAKVGGRLNRPGIHALYLATSAETAIAEYQQGDLLMPPLTLVSYQVQLASVVDFRGGYVPGEWVPLWQELTCNWRGSIMLDGIEPGSWSLGDAVLAAGHSGILFPAQQAIGTNLVVYVDAMGTGDHIAIHDPSGSLPRDQTSWRAPPPKRRSSRPTKLR